MKHKILITFFGIISILALFGCLDKIDFETVDTIEEAIAIQGKITKGNPSLVEVTIRKVFNFADAITLVNASAVTIENREGIELPLSSVQDGIFTLEIPNDHPTFKVGYGDAFRIHVTTLDNRNFSSEFDQLYPVPTPDKLSVAQTEVEIRDKGISRLVDQMTYTISTNIKPPGSMENARLLWEMIGTYKYTDSPDSYNFDNCRLNRRAENAQTCYIELSPVNNYLTLDGTALSMDRVDNFEILNTPLASFYAEGFYLTVFQQSLSPAAFDYWSQVRLVAQREGNIFQPPAGRISTNFSNIDSPKEAVFGFFYATETKKRRIYVSPDLAKNPTLPCPAPIGQSGFPNDLLCCNCATAEKATVERPGWWIF